MNKTTSDYKRTNGLTASVLAPGGSTRHTNEGTRTLAHYLTEAAVRVTLPKNACIIPDQLQAGLPGCPSEQRHPPAHWKVPHPARTSSKMKQTTNYIAENWRCLATKARVS